MWDAFTSGVVDAGRKESVREGLKAFIALYFEEYGDATEIDAETLRALEHLTVLGNLDLLDETLPEIVAEVMKERKRL